MENIVESFVITICTQQDLHMCGASRDSTFCKVMFCLVQSSDDTTTLGLLQETVTGRLQSCTIQKQQLIWQWEPTKTLQFKQQNMSPQQVLQSHDIQFKNCDLLSARTSLCEILVERMVEKLVPENQKFQTKNLLNRQVEQAGKIGICRRG
eukprot:TRINITY_DN18060_c1_g3_i2.p1 TRINITY_DN18060_c1_g3~~TRINITY_DN18060_c1_g3_i2.p1  ORF type:complete len:167 (-),score=8.41 TRINITY_DN18060_c1_g3_i2:202-654(-)